MRWWREARFGMFIHWGVYAQLAGEHNGRRDNDLGEWIRAHLDIPLAEYDQYVNRFNPSKFDAAEWVKIARNAGMKYIVITSKHHDGFSMFDSAVSPYSIARATPYGKDPIAALASECRRQGLKLCFYYSILDWHHPSQTLESDRKGIARYSNIAMKPGRKEEYVAYMRAQLKELLDRYDPAVLWFDGEWVDWWTEPDGRALYNWLRSLKPSLIINNRVGKGRKGMEGLSKDRSYAGDFGTPEQQIPPAGIPGVDWESCMTMNDTWGYKHFDQNWKTSRVLIRNLVDIASKGGNFLLNVGPTNEGLIPAASVDLLKDIGRWMRTNSESIYGTHPGPFSAQLPFGRATARPGFLYLHVFEWPKDGTLAVPSLRNATGKIYLLADRRRLLRAGQANGVLSIAVPASAPDPAASVVVVETRGMPAAG
jgi:alpha-L-fucosidase